MQVTVVIVTYGERLDLLLTTLAAAKAGGAAACILIDNDARPPVATFVAERFGQWATTIVMGRNTGSAPGFQHGIVEACRRGAEYIMLLDDDNVLAQDCLSRLSASFAKASKICPPEKLALVAYRPDHVASRVKEILIKRVPRVESSFRGFHLLDLPRKLAWRLRSPPVVEIGDVETIPLPWGPYGGLLFHHSMIAQVGLPDERFVLYDDDSDFTRRIVQAGGKLLLVPKAIIIDADTSWHITGTPGARYKIWITGKSDLRAFYSFRNGAYCDRRQCGPIAVMFWLNLVVYMIMLATFAIVSGRLNRFRLLIRALRDGLRGRLGEDATLRLTM